MLDTTTILVRTSKESVETLKTVGKSFHVDVDVMEPLMIDGTVVSSSKIRALIKAGDVETAAKLLGRDYPVIGNVVEGAKRGHTLGFPTANLAISEELYPKAGVYAVDVLWNRQPFNGVANIGVNPTFQAAHSGMKANVSFEVYILDFDHNIYGDEIQVSFKKRIRDEVRFGSTADLIRQIQRDVQWAEENVFKRMATINGTLKKLSFAGCSKRARCKAPEILRSEAYLSVRRNDEGRGKRRRWPFWSNLLTNQFC